MRFNGREVIVAIVFAAVVSGCARKEEYAADTAAATVPPADTGNVSTSPAKAMGADTPSRTTTSKPATKSTSTKKAPAKPTY
jgi:Zn-dependent protease with chaperone function